MLYRYRLCCRGPISASFFHVPYRRSRQCRDNRFISTSSACQVRRCERIRSSPWAVNTRAADRSCAPVAEHVVAGHTAESARGQLSRSSRAPEPRGCQRAKGLRGGKRREAVLFFERRVAAPRRIMGIPTAFKGFPPPGLSPGGRGEPQVVATYVMSCQYPTCSPPSNRNVSSRPLQRGGMGEAYARGEGRG